jgi:hypothetical protein
VILRGCCQGMKQLLLNGSQLNLELLLLLQQAALLGLQLWLLLLEDQPKQLPCTSAHPSGVVAT